MLNKYTSLSFNSHHFSFGGGVLDRPLGGLSLVLVVVALEFEGGVGVQSVVCVGRLDNGKNRLDDKVSAESGNPCCVNCLSADLTSLVIDVGVIDFGDELDLWRFEGIVVVEVEVHNKLATDEGSLFGAVDNQVPVEKVVVHDLDFNARNSRCHEILVLLVTS
jgi:hypothetical protein